MFTYQLMKTPIGQLFIVEENKKLAHIFLNEKSFREFQIQHSLQNKKTALLTEAVSQLEEYFLGKRRQFDLPLNMQGTPFQQKVWQALCTIPYGETRSYQEIAIQICHSKAVRAVGQANKANALPIIIPCHRVIGKNKRLTGYAGRQIDKKAFLLDLEKAYYHK